MPKIFGLDVPEGLVELFNFIFGIQTAETPTVLRVANTPVTRIRRTSLLNNSLFSVFQPLYNALTSLQRDDWTTLWGQLPYGSHSGSGGWPGSGFSAYVSVNATRYKLSFPLFDAAPVNPNVDVGYGVGDRGDGVTDSGGNPRHVRFSFVATSADAANGVVSVSTVGAPTWFSRFSLLENPYGTPVELMTNRHFASGMTGWYVLVGSMATTARAAFGGAIVRQSRLIAQNVPIVAGRTYLFSFYFQCCEPF